MKGSMSLFSRHAHFAQRTASTRRTHNLSWRSAFALIVAAGIGTAAMPNAFAAKEASCGATFAIGAQLSGGVISAVSVPTSFSVVGKNVEFQIDSATLAVHNYTLTGASNPDRLTTTPLVVFASKSADLRGAVLTSDISVQVNELGTVFTRSGNGVTIKVQALDCATGGNFQMEAERDDLTSTDFTHVLGPTVFYFNNPNFGSAAPSLPLCPAGGPFTPSCTPIPITPRVNLASDVAPSFVARDSPQDATKIKQTGGTTVWRVISGGRLGGVLGEDSVEIAPPAVPCASHCKAQDQVRGKYPILGFPSPVPANSRIFPR
jgi:hypothetical protein